MKWVEFKSTVQFESLGRNKGPVFEAGSRHQLEDDFADRWIRRGVAIAAEGPLVESVEEAPVQDLSSASEGASDEPKASSRRSKGSSAQA